MNPATKKTIKITTITVSRRIGESIKNNFQAQILYLILLIINLWIIQAKYYQKLSKK